MKRRRALQNPLSSGDSIERQINTLLRNQLFKSACRIVEAGTTDRKRFQQQRAALEKKFGYPSLEGKT